MKGSLICRERRGVWRRYEGGREGEDEGREERTEARRGLRRRDRGQKMIDTKNEEGR